MTIAAEPQQSPRRLPGLDAGAEFLTSARGFLRGLIDWLNEEQAEGEHPPAVAATTPPAQDETDAAGVAYLNRVENMDPRGAVTYQALFVRRAESADQPGTWAFPAGNVESGEAPDDAAAREAREEAGDNVPTDGLVPWDARRTGGVHFRTFAQEAAAPFQPRLNGELNGYTWAPLDAPPEPLHPGLRETLDARKAGDIAMDPLTDKGQTILAAMKKKYGDEEGERVFYASRNKGTISGVDEATDVSIGKVGVHIAQGAEHAAHATENLAHAAESTAHAAEAINRFGERAEKNAGDAVPPEAFLGAGQEYPVQAQVDGAWRYTPELLREAARRAHLNGRADLAGQADDIGAREFGADYNARHDASGHFSKALVGNEETSAKYQSSKASHKKTPDTAGDAPAYHGTRASALQSIRDNGLLGHPNKRYHPDRFYEGDRGASVYLAADPTVALQWALTEVTDPSDATVLQVDVPPEGLVPDEAAAGAERYVGDIPPAWVKQVYPVNPDGSLGQPSPFSADPDQGSGETRFVALVHNRDQQPAAAAGAISPETTAAPAAAPSLDERFQMMPGVNGVMDRQTGQVFSLDDLIAHMSAQDAVPTFERIRDAVKNRATDPAALAAWVKSKLDPEWDPAKDDGKGMDAGTWKRIRGAALDASEDPDKVTGWLKGRLSPSQEGASDAVMAMDWSGAAQLRDSIDPGDRLELAFDRESVRDYDRDGRMHVDEANISKATVNPYWGREIPKYRELGLDPDRKYWLLRDPQELTKAAPTFNRLPILSKHQPLTADAHDPRLVIGATGERASFSGPYLKNSLVFWPRGAIDGIESNAQKQLSSAYHYRADMTPGVYQGQKYDGVMRDIVGNHVALVKEGRAGADVVVGDSMEEDMKGTALSSTAIMAKGALIQLLTPRLAPGKAIDMMALDTMLKDVPEAGAVVMWPGISAMVKEQFTPLLAKDANLDDVPGALGNLPPNAAPPMQPPVPGQKPAQDASVEQVMAWIAANCPPEVVEKMKTDLGMGQVGDPAPAAGPGSAPPATGPNNDGSMDGKTAKDAVVGEQKDLVTKTAMDEKLKEVRDEQRAIFRAVEQVRPWVGALDVMAFDSAPEVYSKALTMLGKKVDGVHRDALWPILEAQPKPSAASGNNNTARLRLAHDAAPSKEATNAAEAFPGLRSITNMG